MFLNHGTHIDWVEGHIQQGKIILNLLKSKVFGGKIDMMLLTF